MDFSASGLSLRTQALIAQQQQDAQHEPPAPGDAAAPVPVRTFTIAANSSRGQPTD